MTQRPHTVRDFISPSPQTISRDITLSEANQLMSDLKIRHLPVVEGGKIIGIVSDRDLRLMVSMNGTDLNKFLVDDVMIREPYQVGPNTSLAEVVNTMAERKLGSALVIENDSIIGIFTTIDALKVLSMYLKP